MNNTIAIAIAAVAAAILIGVALYAWRPATAEDLSPDGQVIEQLRRADSDLSRPHSIEFFLYFPTRDAAVAAGEELDTRAFTVKIDTAAQGPDWLLLLTRSMLPIEADLVTLRTEFDALALRHGGEYDGWGSAVVPRQ
jgi:hypothetical protein